MNNSYEDDLIKEKSEDTFCPRCEAEGKTVCDCFLDFLIERDDL